MTDLLRPRDLQRLRGHEELAPGQTVVDFWRWALGDLRMNLARGYLVEYLVAKALGDKSSVRVEWGPYDVAAADGTLVEIKTSGYLQSWATKKPSTPSWTFKSVSTDQLWSEELGTYLPVEPGDRVHVWVFALQTCQDPGAYDPRSIDQWGFRVMPHRQLLATGQKARGCLSSTSTAWRPSSTPTSRLPYGPPAPQTTNSAALETPWFAESR